MSSCQHGVKESAAMKSEASKNKEIDELVKELGNCYDKLNKRFCEGKLCTECNLNDPYCDCLLSKLQDLIDALEE